LESHGFDHSCGLAALQGELLEIMKYLHGFCMEHGIVYSLIGGSLLGAIRHRGFIPWDDDLDILLDRENYERLLHCLGSSTAGGFVLEPEQWVYRVRKQRRTEKGYVPSVDLFVLDRVPERKLVGKLQILQLRILQGMLREQQGKQAVSPFYRLCLGVTAFLGRFFRKETLRRWYDRLCRLGNSGSGKQTAIFNDRFRLLSLRYGSDLMARVELHDFEDTQFCITGRYHEYLTQQFGDYWQLPPEAERVPGHCG